MLRSYTSSCGLKFVRACFACRLHGTIFSRRESLAALFFTRRSCIRRSVLSCPVLFCVVVLAQVRLARLLKLLRLLRFARPVNRHTRYAVQYSIVQYSKVEYCTVITAALRATGEPAH